MMKYNRVLIFILCFYVLLLLIALAASESLRIVGGRDATDDEYPYVVMLMRYGLSLKDQMEWRFRCTCSVLTPSWTLTSAHCVVDLNKPFEELKHLYKIKYSSRSASETGNYSFSEILYHEVHPGYITRSKITLDDIVLLKTEPINLPIYGKISTLDFTTLYGHEAIAAGYGFTNITKLLVYYPMYIGKPLQVGKFMINKCDGLFPSICLIPTCSQYATLCAGDSGGPVIHPSGTVALFSRGHLTSNCQMVSDIYRNLKSSSVTPVSPYIDWIDRILHDF